MKVKLIILIILTASIISCKDSTEIPYFLLALSQPERLTFSGTGSRGIFDPSLSRDLSGSRIWMSYSAVDPAPTLWGPINYHTVSTRVAYSDDNGKSYVNSATVINPALDVVLGDGAAPWDDDAGTWQNEVSKLVYDPGATAGQEWKLFWHHYLIQNQLGDPTGYRKFNHGWIAYKTASTPEGLGAAAEIKLFGASLYDTVNNTQNNTTSRSPVGGAPAIMLNTLHADLNNCAAFSEPGAYATAASLYVSLFCYEVAPANNRLILLKVDSSTDMTNSGNWTYIGTIFQTSHAVAAGYEKFSASDLFNVDGSTYLMVSPVTSNPIADSYNGCLVYKFSDIDTGALSGSPDVVKAIYGTANSFNGACAYHESATSSGFLYSEADLSATDIFRIYLSHTGL